MREHREHYNSPTRFSAPWRDIGKHQTRTAGTRRLWIYDNKDGSCTCAIAGEGSTWGENEDAAITNAKNW